MHLRKRENRWAKKPAEATDAAQGTSVTGTGPDSDKPKSVLVAIHSQDNKKTPGIMLDEQTFGKHPPKSLFRVWIRAKQRWVYFSNQPDNIYPQEEFPTRGALISFGEKYLQEQEIGLWQKTTEGDWALLSEEDKKALVADSVTVVFKNQHCSLRDIKEAQCGMDGQLITANQPLKVAGLDLKIQAIKKDGKNVKAAIVNSTSTKIVFCSLSSSVHLLIEISKETFSFSNRRNIKLEEYFTFLKSYFEAQDSASSAHELTVYFYSKVFFPSITDINQLYLKYLQENQDPGELASYQVDHRGRIYKDFYQKLVPRKLNSEKMIEVIRTNLFEFLDNLPIIMEGSLKYFDTSSRPILNLNPTAVNDSNTSMTTSVTANSMNLSALAQTSRAVSNNLSLPPLSSINVDQTDPKSPRQSSAAISPGLQTIMLPANAISQSLTLGSTVKKAAANKHFLRGTLSNSSESCILEAIGLVVGGFSIQSDHRCLKTSGYNLIVVTPGDGLYHAEEYFFRYMELKVLKMDAMIALIAFDSNYFGDVPAFVTINDELIAKEIAKQHQEVVLII